MILKRGVSYRFSPHRDATHFLLRRSFKVFGYALNRQGKTHDAMEVRMQSANKAFWKDFLMYKSKDVPVEDQVSTTGGPCLGSLLFWE